VRRRRRDFSSSGPKILEFSIRPWHYRTMWDSRIALEGQVIRIFPQCKIVDRRGLAKSSIGKGRILTMRPEQEPSSVPYSNLGVTTAVLTCAFGLIISAAQVAQAQTFNVIHSFTGGGDGANPVAGPTIKGTTIYGT